MHLRTGLVLSERGGALPKMLLPFRLGLGGRVGSGKQYWSWISIDDLCSGIIHSVQASSLHGPVNMVSPSAVTNLEFTKALGRVLRRPTVFPMPSFAARLAFGEMADALLLASARVDGLASVLEPDVPAARLAAHDRSTTTKEEPCPARRTTSSW